MAEGHRHRQAWRIGKADSHASVGRIGKADSPRLKNKKHDISAQKLFFRLYTHAQESLFFGERVELCIERIIS